VSVAPPGVISTAFKSPRFVLRFCLPFFFSRLAAEVDAMDWSLGLNSVTLAKSVRQVTTQITRSQTQVEVLSVHHVLGPPWALNEPSEDRECAEVGEADPTERFGQALERRTEISLVLTRLIRYLIGR